MQELSLIFIISFIVMYQSFRVIDYINLKDDDKIEYTQKNRIILSIMASIITILIYFKYGLNVYFFKYGLLSVFLILTGFIDFRTQNVYSFLSEIFIVIALLFIIFDKNNNFILYVEGTLITLLISFLLNRMELINGGDIEIYVIAALFMGGTISVFNIFLSIAISGLQAIYILVTRKCKENNKFALCPYIAISTCLLLII